MSYVRREWKRREAKTRQDPVAVRLAHWILVPPTLADEALEAAGRAALEARGKVFREGDELIFQDFWGAKSPLYLKSESLATFRRKIQRSGLLHAAPDLCRKLHERPG